MAAESAAVTRSARSIVVALVAVQLLDSAKYLVVHAGITVPDIVVTVSVMMEE
jgi:hypothetical protein